MTISRRSTHLLLAGTAIALVATGCGSSASPTSAPTAAAPATTAIAPAGGGAVAPAAAGTRVVATLTEFKVQLSQSTVAPGTYTFVATNAGTTGHALVLSGPGLTGPHTDLVQPGHSAEVTVTLQAGSYQVFCPVGTHRQLGMDAVLTVGGASAASPAPSNATTTAGGGGY